MESVAEYTASFFLSAGESDAQGCLPVPLLVERIIEVATGHANTLGIGYDALIRQNIGWVLSRLSVEMVRYPRINENYSIRTWIESINRRFSERNFVILDGNGAVAGYARSVWSAIDFGKRTGADLTAIGISECPMSEAECPIERTPRIPYIGPEARQSVYTFRFCDLDFNRHVNTVRYLELLLDQWGLAHYDSSEAARVDLLFHHECRYGEQALVRIDSITAPVANCEISREAVRAVAARFTWRPRR
ncbi:MAG: acyl-[acyl-carrier-protein] thioesterase [Muribaculaceae bacterium]